MTNATSRVQSMNQVPLSSSCRRITDGTHLTPEFRENGIPFLFVSNILEGKIIYNTDKFISSETYSELTRRCPIDLGDILYTIVGSYCNAAVVEEGRPF